MQLISKMIFFVIIPFNIDTDFSRFVDDGRRNGMRLRLSIICCLMEVKKLQYLLLFTGVVGFGLIYEKTTYKAET